MMVYVRFHLLILLPVWSLITITLFLLIFFCQLISSSSKFDNQVALTIVKSIDDYLCQNYVFTCFFRQRYHQFDNQQQSNNCKSLLILHSCLHYDTDSIRMCHQTILKQAKLKLTNETPINCLTSSIYKKLYTQHLRSIALRQTIINRQIFVCFIFSLFVSFFST